jgi:hypothetical protein
MLIFISIEKKVNDLKNKSIYILVILFFLIGCNPSSANQNTSSSSSQSLHNYSPKALRRVLLKHPEFPELKEGEVATEDAMIDGKNVKVDYLVDIETETFQKVLPKDNDNSHNSGNMKALYIVTLKRAVAGDSKSGSFWKYEYDPEDKSVTLIDSNIAEGALNEETESESNSIGNPTAEEIVLENKGADIFVCNGLLAG